MSATTAADYKLGKAAVRSDVRTLLFARYADKQRLPTPPERFDGTKGVPEWPMYLNDQLGDCTCAAAGHMIEAWTAEAGGQVVEITDDAVRDAFEQVKQVDPRTGEEGAVELDVLNYWRRTGIGRHQIKAYAAVSRADHEIVRSATSIFGGLYIGLQLPKSAQNQPVWDWTGTLSGDAEPGSWGGHAVNVVGYDPQALTVITWGATQGMSWSFWDRYCDEAYCIVSADFMRENRAPNGLDIDALMADLALVSG
jgi:hypothetical protein